jgi:class 3 adenylate cyclase
MRASGTTGQTELPSETVTLLFTNIEGLTRLLQQLGDGYSAVLADHHRLMRAALANHNGRQVHPQGDSFVIVFASVLNATKAACEAQQALTANAWRLCTEVRVRMALHTGEPTLSTGVYLGLDVQRAARLCAAGHGGQVLVQTGNKLGIANCLEGLAGVALAHDRPADAARLLGSVEALLEMVGGTLQWGARARFERDRDAARTRLGDAAFSAATAEGRGLGLEQAIDYALDEPVHA